MDLTGSELDTLRDLLEVQIDLLNRSSEYNLRQSQQWQNDCECKRGYIKRSLDAKRKALAYSVILEKL